MERQSDNGAAGDDDCRVDDHPGGLERSIVAVARRRHGIVTRQQLLKLGLGAGALDDRIRRGWLSVVHRGVYLVGGATLTWRAREIAAALACGPPAVVSDRSAACFWRMLAYLPDSTTVSVTVPPGPCRARPGIDVHRRRLERRDYVIREAIPVTTPARTILDLAAGGDDEELERAISEGQARRLLSLDGLADQVERNPRRAGTGVLRRALELGGGPAPTRSEAERRMLRLIRSAGLPSPEANVGVGGYEVDFLWRRQRLVVEVDGWRFHSSRRSFERDRVRDAELAAKGLTVVRITWRQLAGAPEAVVARIAAALATRR
jgi:very-short-patch-repair endonuclease